MDEAETKRREKHPLHDLWRLALCYEGASSREEARKLMKGAWYSAYERARKDPRMMQTLRHIGDLYQDFYGWETPAGEETAST